MPAISVPPPEKKVSPQESSGENSPAAPAAVKAPDLSEIRARSQRDVASLIQTFAEAYRSRDMTRISVLFPTMPPSIRKTLAAMFQAAREIEFELTPLEAPDIRIRPDGTPQSAAVRCKRILRMTPRSGITPKPQQDTCLFELERVDGSWRITGQQ